MNKFLISALFILSSNFVLAEDSLKELPAKNIQVPVNCTKIDTIDGSTVLNKIDSSHPINLILVSKAKNKIYFMHHDQVLYAFRAAFGTGYSDGAKAQEGDNRTPEGTYFINSKNPNSKFYKALQVSYPNTGDVQFARKYGVSAGGDIMVHGISNSFGSLGHNQTIASTINMTNWTAGCIAIRNDQMDKVYSFVSTGTRIEICPL